MPSHGADSGDPGPRVVNNIGNVAGAINQYNAPVWQGGETGDLRRQLEEGLTELRRAILAAEQHNELSSAESRAALVQLDGATARVRASVKDGRHLALTLGRIKDALSGGLGVLAQLAAVIAAVKGL